MADYRLATRFEITAPIHRVWSALSRPEIWVSGWGEVTDVLALEPGAPHHEGARHVFNLKPLRFATLQFETEITRARAPDIIEWEVSGDLEGRAAWELDDLDEITIGRNIWDIRTTPAWLNAVAPAARSIYRRRQDGLMRRGLEALASHLGAGLLTVHTSAYRPERHRFADLALRVGPGARRTSDRTHRTA
jgi:hypothetical protein